MAAPVINNTNYTQVSGAPFPSVNGGGNIYYAYSCVAFNSTLWIFDNINSQLRSLNGDGTLSSPLQTISGVVSSCMGINQDATLVYLIDKASGTNNVYTIGTSSPYTVTTYTKASGSNSLTKVLGNIYISPDGLSIFCSDNGNSIYRGPIKISLDAGTSKFTVVGNAAWCESITPTPGGNILCIGCTLLDSDYLCFAIQDTNASSANMYKVYRCSLATQGSSATNIALSFTGSPLILTDIFAVNQFQSFYFLLLSDSNSNRILEAQMSGGSQTGTATIYNTTGTTTSINYPAMIAASFGMGNTTGNLRLFISVAAQNGGNTNTIVKLYNQQAAGGPIGSSVGGDPHLHTFKGESIIIVRDKPFEYLNTHPPSFEDDGDVHTQVVCDCFSLKDGRDDFGKTHLSKRQYDEVITNLDDSYLKSVTFVVGDKKYKINTLTLLFEDEFSFEQDCGEEINTLTFFASKVVRSLTPGEIEVRSKYAKKSVIAMRRILITGERYTLNFELTRTECIHVCDLDLRVDGVRDPFTFGGVVVDGEVKTPREKV